MDKSSTKFAGGDLGHDANSGRSLRSAGVMAGANAATAIVGLFNTVAIAHWFGTSRNAEILFAGLTLVVIFHSFFQVTDFLLPKCASALRGGVDVANEFSSVLLNWAILIVVISSICLYLASGPLAIIIAPGFGHDEVILLSRVFRGLIPVFLFSMLNALLLTLGNARSIYGKLEIHLFEGSLLGLITFVCLVGYIGIWAPVLGQCVTNIYTTFRNYIYLRMHGFNHSMQIKTKLVMDAPLSAKDMASAVASVIFGQIYVFIFTAALTMLSPGVLAIYKYAENLYSRFGSIFLRPVSIVLLTDTSMLVSMGAFAEVRKRLKKALHDHSVIYAGIVVVFIPVLPHLLSGLWGSSRFSGTDILATSHYVYALFGILVIEGWMMLYQRINIANGRAFWQYIGVVIVYIVCSLSIGKISNLSPEWFPVIVIALLDFLNLLYAISLSYISNKQVVAIPVFSYARPFIPMFLTFAVVACIGMLFPWMGKIDSYDLSGKLYSLLHVVCIGTVSMIAFLMFTIITGPREYMLIVRAIVRRISLMVRTLLVKRAPVLK